MDDSDRARFLERSMSYVRGPAHKAGEPGAVIRYDREGQLEMVNLIWGFAPPAPRQKPFTLIRSEGRRFGIRRCLIPASEFYVSKGHGEHRRRWRVTLIGADLFYFAAVWRPREEDWLSSYAILTVEGNADIAPYKERQLAVIRSKDRYAWLNHALPQDELLQPLPAHSFHLAQTDGPTEQRLFAPEAVAAE